VQTQGAAAMINSNITGLAAPKLWRNNKTETMYRNAIQNYTAANMNKNTSAPWIITDLPSYYIVL
jgi:hypothetical protein